MPKRPLKHRITHTCKVALPEKGGVQTVANEICKSLANEFQSTLISTIRASSGDPPSIENLDYILKKPLFEFKSLPVSPGLVWSLWQSAANSATVVIHYPFPLADIAIALLPNRFKRIVVYWHSDIIEQKSLNKLLMPFTRVMLKNSTAIVVSSPRLIEHSELLQPYKSKCRVIPFGYEPDPDQQIADDGYYLCIGRHVKYKGIRNLINALPKTQARLIIIGSGPLLDEHADLARSLGISDRICFIQGASDSLVARHLSRCRALILPSVSPNEAFGLVQIEALSYGKPVINTQLASAVPWVARDGIEAITVPPGDINALGEAINRLENDERLRQQLSGNAYTRWQSTFTMRLFQQRTLDFFKTICEL